ncbi:hypothetical protein IMSHALPRED_004347 [Imshaugia aleurites]|uniref:Uncharacterized protein n=1 Tax=Imshaugia aleurites TaxID=172621 RepID=A0A8H3J8K8_9LECA|nr:hypothetical protein IMSHALPRED_004347 [Imshaugia aleurites]
MKVKFALFSIPVLLFYFVQSISSHPLQLDLPILIDSSLSNSTTLPRINTSFSNVFPCFYPGTDHLPTNYQDCGKAIMEMPPRTDPRTYTFGRGLYASYKLPKTFINGTCLVNLDMVYDEQEDDLTFSEIRDAAFNLAIQCAAGGKFKMGGVAAVRPRNVMYITIMGVRP